jgi:adenylate cyclase
MHAADSTPFRLSRTGSDESYDLAAARPLCVGRGSEADIIVADSTISRRHAELQVVGGAVQICDLGSSNGTFLNGRRVDSATATAGDLIAFGRIAFVVEQPGTAATPVPEPLIVLRRPVQGPPTLAETYEHTMVAAATTVSGHELTQRRLSLLLQVSTSLGRSGSIDALLDRISRYVFQIMDVDCVAILLSEDGELVPYLARDRQGGAATRAVPRSIVRRVVEERVAVLSDNAPEDERFAGASIVAQSIRSAMCVPLIGLDAAIEGVLYVDNLSATQRFNDADLEFLIAFSGIAAVAIENGHYAERIRREAVARGNFERFFTPALAARIASSPDALQLGGEKRTAAILFSDIRGFTAMAEQLPPEQLATLLSEYFTAMVDCVFRHGGTLDKFIGDAIMAQWGAPVSSDDDADRALLAAFDMLHELDALNRRWREEGRPNLRIGIGINTGEVFAGYVGSERRLEYTVLGDAVNVASRLCSAASSGEILITAAVLERLRQRPQVEERAGLQLKGKSRPMSVHVVHSTGSPG